MSAYISALDLPDLLFPIDSSPVSVSAQDCDNPQLKSRSPTPGPLDEQEMLAMRTKALNIRSIRAKGKGKEDSREHELVDMVLRLTAALPSRSQILDQAATISRLSTQQDFLINRMGEERERWEAERVSMYRVSEALMTQANMASHNVYKDQDHTKRPAILESENASLRQKLLDAHSRMSSLEAELSQLRPLLLMQPHAIAVSKGLMLPPGRPRKKESTGGEENRSYYRVREDKTPIIPKSRKKKLVPYFKHPPTVADARSEHLLLAARKLGKERATMMSQAMYRTIEPPPPVSFLPLSPDKGKGKAAEGHPGLGTGLWSHTPQPQPQPQTSGLPGAPTPQNTLHPPFSSPGMPYPPPPPAQQYMMPPNSVPRPGPHMPAHTFYHPQSGGFIPGPANVPNQRALHPPSGPSMAGPSRAAGRNATPASNAARTATGAASKLATQNGNKQSSAATQQIQKTPQSKSANAKGPPTPMDSLLSAARTVFSPDAGGSPQGAAGLQNSRLGRFADDGGKPDTEETRGSTSALDVLADQAVVFDPSSRHSRNGSVSPVIKDNGMESLNDNVIDDPPARPAPSRLQPSRKRKQPGTATTSTSTTTATRTTRTTSRVSQRQGAQSNGKAGTVNGARKARQSARAPPLRMSLTSSMGPQRSASEEKSPSTARMSVSSQISSDSFRLRPVQAGAFTHSDVARAGPSRSASVPHRGASHLRKIGTAQNRLSPTATPVQSRSASALASVSAVASIPASAMGGGEEDHDSEDEDEEDQLQNEDDEQEGKNSVQMGAISGAVDANSRRWMQILGRKDA
ncbi:hypothetical protein EW145_g2853 [Phellinidium pouzarii]|uniref:Uncharacterized protein n=1 Tax=Phellinidium pouzarii TaxID=167371 RepID=A0A4S4L993_9AGAM|nr:hypothetical protein EW145_g2853 [Phellinidium pouzarii]